ncbi:MAG: AsmA-like C-terminal region-containing protein [Ferruginibacter sp.]
MIKRIIKRLLLFLFILICVALAAPFIFKNKIVALVKKEINRNINAKVDFTNVNISFFRSFPKVSVGLDDLQVLGIDAFASDTLLSAKRLNATVDFMSFIRGTDMNIYSIVAESPRIHAIVSKSGLANWDIIKEKDTMTPTVEEKPFTMQLQHYAIKNGFISYIDEQAGASSEVLNLNHQGTGDFTAGLFTLRTTTQSDAVTVIYGGIPYLTNAKTVVNTDIVVDNKAKVYRFNTDEITVNDVKVNGKGTIKNLEDKGYDLDIQFRSLSAEFRNLLSLVPVIYQRDFDKIKTSGTAAFSGSVKGIYNETEFPAYHLDMQVKNGFFQYQDLPMPLKQIDFNVKVDNPNGQTDNTVINIVRAHFEMDREPFDFRLLVIKPASNMFIDAAAKGKLDLSKISQFIKLEKDTRLSGLLNADVNVKGNVMDIERRQYDQFSAGGTVSLSNFLYAAKDYPTGIKINNLLTSFTPARVDISNLSGQYLGSNFIGSGQVNNLLSYLINNKPLNAVLSLSADNVNGNVWIGGSTDTTATGATAAPFIVPANLDLVLNTTIGKLHYDKIDIQNLTGSLKVKDEAVAISNVKGNALDGSIMVSGLYSTKISKTKPDIVLEYDVTGVDVQKTFYAFNTVQKLMPIGKFVAGKLTSHLSLNGKLGENMMPDMTTLSGIGNLLLIEGFLSKFAPLDKIASTLNVKALEQISLRDVKNYFEFSNGKLLIKPFTVNVSGIDMEIGGLQGFDQSLQYIINMKLPRSLMGDKGNQLVNSLVSQVNNKGVPLKVGETVNLNLKLGGYFNSPTVKTDLKQGAENLADQLKQQVTDFARAKIDSAKQVVTNAVKDTIASIKKQATNTAKEELAKQLSGNKNPVPDSTKTRLNPKESVKGLMDNLLKKGKDSAKKQ